MAMTADVAWPQRRGLIAIHARTFRDYRALADACAQAGYSTAWCSPAQPLHASGFAAVIVDGIAADDVTAARIGSVVRQVQPVPVVMLLDYVRRQDYDRAVAAGAAAVIAKPMLTFDLLWHLDDLISGPNRKHDTGTTSHATTSATSAA
jgi:AmiR/NasT family two-component response regulator